LIEFLTTELELSSTFVRIAEQNREIGGDEYERSLQNARKALETIRHFEGRITDPEAWQRIHERGDTN
jgi:hypothetical protein